MDEGNYRDAVTYFENARQSSPSNKTVTHNLSMAYHKLAQQYGSKNDWANAILNEGHSLKYNPENDVIKQQLGIFYNNLALEYANSEEFDAAQDKFKTALEYFPGSETIKTNFYNTKLRYAEKSLIDRYNYKAQSLADEAIELLPAGAGAYLFLGDMYYKNDDFKKALLNWNKAMELDPANEELRDREKKIKKEKQVEESFNTRKRMFFRIRYDKEMDSEYVWAISNILDDARREIRSRYRIYNSSIIPVIVYTSEQYKHAVTGPYWTQGLYDGKIRLMEQDISKSDDVLRKILFHEYAHAILFLTYGGNIPTWLHEGFAQFNEPEMPYDLVDKNFIRLYLKKDSRNFFIEKIDDDFSNRDDLLVIKKAYLESKLILEYLVDKYGKYKLSRLLNELKDGKDWQEAFKEIYRRNTERFNEDFREYLSGYKAP
ncbi:MAG: tetratricopeptide repeat protein [Candidatus Omnitrophota bacterium]